MKALPLLPLVLLSLHPMLAQPPSPKVSFRRITVEHGLPASRVSVITQTRDGVIWFGTREGLCKYEGGGITVYQPTVATEAGAAGNDVRALAEDRSGVLWVGVFNAGLFRFDRVSGKLTQYRNDPSTPNSLSDNRVLSILEDRQGTLWIGTVRGLNIFDRTNQVFSQIMVDPENPMSLSENRIWPLAEDREGSLWIGTLGGGLNTLDRSTGAITVYRNDPGGSNSLANNTVVALHKDRTGSLWIGMENGGLDEFIHEKDEFDRDRREFRHHLHGMHVTSICEDSVGNIIAGTLGSGLKVLDRKTRTASTITADPSNPHALADNVIRCVFVDASGTLWVGTENGGVSVVTRTPGRKQPSQKPR